MFSGIDIDNLIRDNIQKEIQKEVNECIVDYLGLIEEKRLNAMGNPHVGNPNPVAENLRDQIDIIIKKYKKHDVTINISLSMMSLIGDTYTDVAFTNIHTDVAFTNIYKTISENIGFLTNIKTDQKRSGKGKRARRDVKSDHVGKVEKLEVLQETLNADINFLSSAKDGYTLSGSKVKITNTIPDSASSAGASTPPPTTEAEKSTSDGYTLPEAKVKTTNIIHNKEKSTSDTIKRGDMTSTSGNNFPEGGKHVRTSDDTSAMLSSHKETAETSGANTPTGALMVGNIPPAIGHLVDLSKLDLSELPYKPRQLPK